MKPFLAFFLSVLFISNYAFAANQYSVGGFDNDAAVEAFARDFKQAVISGDRNKVASMVESPIEDTSGGKSVLIKSPEEFLKRYDYILDKNLCAKIANFETKDLFANYQGVMMVEGDAWFGNSDGKIKVVSIGICRRYIPEQIK